MSWYQTSRPSGHVDVLLGAPQRRAPSRSSVCPSAPRPSSPSAGRSARGASRRRRMTSTLAPASLMRPDSESAEKPANTTVCGAPMPRAREHHRGQLGHHRHVDRDAVALRDAELGERVRDAARLVQEPLVGDRLRVARLAFPVVGDLVAEAGLDVAVEAVVGDVQRAADEPLRERRVPLEDGVPRLEPRDVRRRPASPRTLRSPAPPRRRSSASRTTALARERRPAARRSAAPRGGSRC